MHGYFSWIRRLLQGFGGRYQRRANRRRLRKNTVRLYVERLEARVVPIISTWIQTGTGSFSWENAGNWSSLPQAGSCVLIPSTDAASSQTITLDGFFGSINTITVQATGAITISAGNAALSVLGVNTLSDSAGTGTLTISANIDVTAGTINNASSNPLAISGTVGGTTITIDMTGMGTVIFSNAGNNYTTTTISAGTLQIGNNSAGSVGSGAIANDSALVYDTNGATTLGGVLSSTGSVNINAGEVFWTGKNTLTGATTIASGATLELGANGATTVSSYAGNFTDNGTLVFNTTAAGGTFSEPISGSGAVRQVGSGLVILDGANTYMGVTTINSGATLQVGNGGAAGSIANSPNVIDNGNLAINETGTITFSANISGSGGFTQAGSGATVLSGANTYSGVSTITGGVLQVGSDAALGDDPNTATAGMIVLNGGELFATAGFTLNSNRGIAVGANAGGDIDVQNDQTLFYGGILKDNTTLGVLTVGGSGNAGNLKLTGNNTYTGNTAVAAGTLIDDGSLTSVVNVGTSGTLAGGLIPSATAPLAGLTLSSGGTLNVALNGASLGSYTQFTSSGAVNLGIGTEGTLTLTLGYAPTTSDYYDIIVNNSGSAPGAFDGIPEGGTISATFNSTRYFFAVSYTGLSYAGGTTTQVGGVNDVVLSVVPKGDIYYAEADGWAAQNGGQPFSVGQAIPDADPIAPGAQPAVFGGNTAVTGSGYTAFSSVNAALAQMNIDFPGGGAILIINGGTFSEDVNVNIRATLFLQSTTSTFSSLNATASAGSSIQVNGVTLVTGGDDAPENVPIPITGSGNLQTAGTGDLVLDGANTAFTNSGTTTVVSGSTLQIGNNSLTAVTGSGGISDNGTLIFNTRSLATVGNVISGSGTLLQQGPGTVILTAANTLTGGTTINSGAALQIGRGGATGSLTGAITDNGNFTFDTSTNLTDSGVISGSGSLTQIGAALITLTGANSYNGPTSIGPGALTLANPSFPGNGAVPGGDITDDGTLYFNTGAAATFTGNLTGFGSLVLGGTSGNNLTLSGSVINFTGNIPLGSNTLTVSVASLNLATLSGVIRGAGELVQAGAGTLILAGANLYTGGTTVNSGATLQLGNDTATGSVVGNITDSGAVVTDYSTISTFAAVMSGSGAFFQEGIGTVILTGANTLTGGATINSGDALQVGAGGATGSLTGPITDNGKLILNSTSTTLTVSGAISGAGSLTQAGTGTTTLTGTNSYNGLTTISAGGLTLDSPSFPGNGAVPGGNIVDNGTLTFKTGATSTFTGNLTGAGGLTLTANNVILQGSTVSLGGNVALGASTLTINAATVASIGGNISGAGNLTQTGTATLVLTGASTFTGNTTIASGSTLQIGNNGATTFSGAGGVTDNGTLIFNTASASTIAGAISGPGTLVQQGGGTLILTAANTLTGAAIINSGDALQIGAGGASGSFAGAITDNGKLTFNSASTTLTDPGAISGAGSLTQAGTGTTTLAGANSYRGLTTISAGGLTLANPSFPGDGSVPGGNIVDNGTLTFSTGATSTFTGNITGGGNLALTGNDVILQGATVTFGGSVILDPSTLTIDAATAASIGGIISGAGNLTQAGAATLILTGANTYTGTTTIDSGSTLQVGNNGTTGTIPAASTVIDNGTLVFDMNSVGTLVVAAGITGAGTIDQAGAGTAAMTGANTYTGATTITRGILEVGSDSELGTAPAAPMPGSLVISGGELLAPTSFTLNSNRGIALGAATRNDIDVQAGQTLAYAGILTGAALTVNGGGNSGTFLLGGPSTYNGATTIDAGTLDLQGSLAGSAVTVGVDGTLEGTGTASGAVAVHGAIAGGDTSNSVGNLSVGSLSFTGGAMDAQVNGPSAGQYSTITSSGAVALGTAANLNVTVAGTYLPLASGNYDLLVNKSGSISGSFTNAAGGSVSDTGHLYSFQVAYNGGSTSSDVVLSYVPPLSIVVTTNSDANSHTGVSLRDAVNTANSDANAGESVDITFAPSLKGQTITLVQGLITFGGGPGIITVDGGSQVTVSGDDDTSIFQVNDGTTAVIENLTITDGTGTVNGTAGINVYPDGALTVNNCVFSANEATALASGGTLTVNNSTFSTTNNGSAVGGNGNATLTGCEFLNNTGGAINFGGNLTVTGSTFIGNSTSGGGACIAMQEGSLAVNDCKMISNVASDSGGAIYADITSTVSNSEFDFNSAGGGGAIDNEGTMTVIGSTFSGNIAGSSQQGNGGAIYNHGGMTVDGSTFSGNVANGDGGAMYDVINSAITVSDCTISGNSANDSTGGGGVSTPYGVVYLNNSIVAGNSAPNSIAADYTGGVSGKSYNNLIGNGAGMTGLTNGYNGNMVGSAGSPINPMLAPLSDSGGPTQTMALLPGSPAINTGGALTTLLLPITTSSTTLTLSTATALSQATGGDFVVQIDSEQFLVTYLTGSSFTILQHGYDGTTPNSHGANAGVFLADYENGQPSISGGETDMGASGQVFSNVQQISFVNQPASTTAGSTFTPLTVLALDANNNPVAGVLVTLNISYGTLSGTTTATTNMFGQAVFNNVSENIAGTYLLTASVVGLPVVSSSAFTIAAGNPAMLTFITQPIGNVVYPLTVQAVDAYGNPLAGVNVNLGISQGVLDGTTTATTNASGQAVFGNLAVPAANTYTLTATAGSLSATSNSFTTTAPTTNTITVTTNLDTSSPPGESLREAVNTANTDAGNGISDTIVFAPALDGRTITLTRGLITFGGGPGVVTVDGGSQVTVSGGDATSIFQVNDGTTAVIENLTITDGTGTVNGTAGINVYPDGTLTVNNCLFSANEATALASGGTLTVNGSTFSTTSNGSAVGGRGNATLTDCQFLNNTGGAINFGGNLAVIGSTFTGNSSSGGGAGINMQQGTLDVDDCMMISNIGGGSGGAIYADITATVTNTEFDSNLGDSGGAIDNEATMTIGNCTFSGNAAVAGDSGGAIYNHGQLTVDNSTFNGNLATGYGGAMYDQINSTITVSNCTISGNTADGSSGGGGISTPYGVVFLNNTIVAGNFATDSTAVDYNGSIDGNSDNNLIGNGTGMSGLTSGYNGNLVGTAASPINPQLSSLAYNGGPTQTMLLSSSSSAFNAGEPTSTSQFALTPASTAIALSNWTTFAVNQGADFVIQVDNEQMLVTYLADSSFTILQHGYNGTMPADHAVGAAVFIAQYENGPTRVHGGQTDIGAASGLYGTAISLTDDTANPTTFGTSVSFTVNVVDTGGGSAIPDGSVVTLEDQNNSDMVVGTGTLTSGMATINVANLSVGAHEIFAVFAGNSSLALEGNISADVAQTILYSTTTTAPTTAASSVLAGAPITFTATVSPTNLPRPGGTISFYDNGNLIGSSSVGTKAGLTSATITDSFPVAGVSHNITAQYNGDGTTYAASAVSNAFVETVVTTPSVLSVVVNGDPGDSLAGTYSRVASLYVTFNEAVQLDSGAFGLALHNNVTVDGVTGQQVGTLPAGIEATSSDNIHWTLRFTGTNGVNVNVGADGRVTIMDGVYDLTIAAGKVHPVGNTAINMASSVTQTFWALFGDTGGNDSITTGTIGDGGTMVSIGMGDFNAFASAFGSAGYNVAQGYNPVLDVNGDGSIDVPDFDAFSANFGTCWIF